MNNVAVLDRNHLRRGDRRRCGVRARAAEHLPRQCQGHARPAPNCALSAGELAQVIREAHLLKGASLNVGATAIGECAGCHREGGACRRSGERSRPGAAARCSGGGALGGARSACRAFAGGPETLTGSQNPASGCCWPGLRLRAGGTHPAPILSGPAARAKGLTPSDGSRDV